MIVLNPYLGFRDNAREAIKFYESVFGGELVITSYKDGGMSRSPSDENNVMHSMLKSEKGLTLMASDVPEGMEADHGTSISLSLSGQAEDEAVLRGYWEKLAVGGVISQPLVQSPWGDLFGMLTDKFGTQWMINIAAKK